MKQIGFLVKLVGTQINTVITNPGPELFVITEFDCIFKFAYQNSCKSSIVQDSNHKDHKALKHVAHLFVR